MRRTQRSSGIHTECDGPRHIHGAAARGRKAARLLPADGLPCRKGVNRTERSAKRQPLRVHIVTPASTGLVADERVLIELLGEVAERRPVEVERTRVPNFAGVDPSMQLDWPKPSRPFDVQFLLESAWPIAKVRSLAKHHVLVANMEFIDESTLHACRQGFVDTIWAKTQLTVRLAATMLPKVPCDYTGWTSTTCRRQASAGQQDFRRFLHVRGKALHKQTQAVVDCWLANPSFPTLDIVLQDANDLSFSEPLRGGNIIVHQRFLGARELARLQNEAGVHVCTSLIEGFGHYINEARSCGAVVVTPDGPPMRELVDTANGFLVRVAGKVRMVAHGVELPQADINARLLAQTIERVLTTPEASLRSLGAESRRRFLSEKRAFYARALPLLLER